MTPVATLDRIVTLARRHAALGLIAALMVATACASEGDAAPSTARVARVVDGDTLVLVGGGRVRLVQVDAPEESRECHARASTRALRSLAPPGSSARLETDPALDRVDTFGRFLRYVHVRGVNVNVELVRRGAATPWFYDGDRGRYAPLLLAAMLEARGARRGVWGACRVSWAPDRRLETRPR